MLLPTFLFVSSLYYPMSYTTIPKMPLSNPSPSIPIVDFSNWTHGTLSQKQSIATTLVSACRTFGFCYITNHDISTDYLSHAFAISQKLFNLPHEAKMQAPHPPGFAVHRGYSWPGLEKVSNAMGDEENKEELTQNLRSISDIKVRFPQSPPPSPIHNNGSNPLKNRKVTRSAASKTPPNPTSGSLNHSSPVSAPSLPNSTGPCTPSR